jgi:exosortase
MAAFGSVELAQALGVSVIRQGMDLSFPSGRMTIEGACSGLNSLIALLALGSLFAYFGSGPAWRRVLLFLCSVPVAVAANIVRITSLCVVAAMTTTEKATGLFHDIGGFVLFGVALLAMGALKRILRC